MPCASRPPSSTAPASWWISPASPSGRPISAVSAAPAYRELFGTGTGGALALYRHEHDHADHADHHHPARGHGHGDGG